MSIVRSDEYEDLAADFQYEQVRLLRAVLKKYGVTGAQAKEICGEFTFDLSMLFDQGEFELGGETYRPCICFTPDEEKFHVQSAGVEFHEYAFGTVADIFESERSGG